MDDTVDNNNLSTILTTENQASNDSLCSELSVDCSTVSHHVFLKHTDIRMDDLLRHLGYTFQRIKTTYVYT